VVSYSWATVNCQKIFAKLDCQSSEGEPPPHVHRETAAYSTALGYIWATGTETIRNHYFRWIETTELKCFDRSFLALQYIILSHFWNAVKCSSVNHKEAYLSTQLTKQRWVSVYHFGNFGEVAHRVDKTMSTTKWFQGWCFREFPHRFQRSKRRIFRRKSAGLLRSRGRSGLPIDRVWGTWRGTVWRGGYRDSVAEQTMVYGCLW
jgi:hypothetical protein